MRCIVPWYNADTDFAKALFDRLLERDIRTLASNDTWPLLYRVYCDTPEYYQEKLLSAAHSEIADLSKYAFEMITVLAAEDDYLLDSLLMFPLNTAQAQFVCLQAVHLFANESYHRKGQTILEHLIDVCDDLPQLGQLFYQKVIDPQRDREFLIRLISHGNMSHMAYEFIEYLREYDGSILEYADIIFAFAKMLFGLETSYYRLDDFIICIARLFHQGKDDIQTQGLPRYAGSHIS